MGEDWYRIGERLLVTHGDPATFAFQMGRRLDRDFLAWCEDALTRLYLMRQGRLEATDRERLVAELGYYRPGLAERLMTDAEIAEAIAAHCRLDAIDPQATVIIGHFHAPWNQCGTTSGR